MDLLLPGLRYRQVYLVNRLMAAVPKLQVHLVPAGANHNRDKVGSPVNAYCIIL